jgi:hypothetical protein
MSLAIVFKGTEGLVLAVDSRVTLNTTVPGAAGQPNLILSSTFDNATKFLKVNGHEYVGAVTYGTGAIGQREPRTAHSFIPELEEHIGKGRLSVKDFAAQLGQFFLQKWTEHKMPSVVDPLQDMVFIVGGFDLGEPYGRVYELHIPSTPEPVELNADDFGVVWGGQSEFIHRLISGYDPRVVQLTQEFLSLPDEKVKDLLGHLKGKVQAAIPFQFLPLQDCVNLAILLIRTTMTIQTFLVNMRGVGGAIDVATITRTDGLRKVQLKEIRGESER